MKKFSIILLIFTLTLGNISFGQGYKEESIYGLISENGDIEKIYVVNASRDLQVDYGNYQSIENLSTLDALNMEASKISLPEYDQTFYYQGTLDEPDLPWDFEIEYLLNQQPISLKDLAGASGALSIKINIKPGPYTSKDFYDNYALQVSLNFSNDLTTNLKAEGATLVEAGGKKQVTYTILPGQGARFEITANIIDFEMDPITINGVKMVFDMTVDTSALTEELENLTQAVSELDEGALEISKGLNQISVGLSDYTAGMKAYKDGVYQLSSGGTELTVGLKEISDGLLALKTQEDILKGGISALKLNALTQVDEKLKAMGLELPSLTEDNYEEILGQDENFIPIIIELEQSLQFAAGLETYITTVGMLSDGTTTLTQGLNSYVSNASTLASTTQTLYESSRSLNQGLLEIKKAMTTYQLGTEVFKNETQSLDTSLEEKINDMLGSFSDKDYKVESFVSKENEEVMSVQFFFRSQGIKQEAVKTVVETEKTLSLWERIKKLFGFLK